jgi:nucleoside-diphosphate-sugar epimerase
LFLPQGAFAEYALQTVFGVNQETKTIVFPQSGAASLTHTPLTDVGSIVADAIVTGRGRNQVIYTAAATYTYEEFAQLLEKVTGSAWKRVTRSKAESEAMVKANPYAFISLFELVIGTNAPNPACSWPVEKTYNYQHKILMQPIEELFRKGLKA